MQKTHNFILFSLLILIISAQLFVGCANIIPPGGGPKDSLPPKLVLALPKDSAVQVALNKFTLTFDEYVEVKDIQQNVVVQPYPKNTPIIDYKLKNVFIKWRDSLEPNTTYCIHFGNSLRDVNEGNPLKNFDYVFSTGKNIDNGSFSGKVVLAETGKIDSTLIVVLHRNLTDTSIIKNSPRFYTKLNGKGEFQFKYLPRQAFNVYVLPNDFTKKYDDTTKLFAFYETPVTISDSLQPITLFAYEEVKKKKQTTSTNTGSQQPKPKEVKVLKYSTSLVNNTQDVLSNTLDLSFSEKLKTFDTSRILLCDTNYQILKNYSISLDSLKTTLSIKTVWELDKPFRLIIKKDAAKDTTGLSLNTTDTIRFFTRKEEDYGSLLIKLFDFDLKKNPVLQIIKDDKIIESITITSNEISRKLFNPNEYDLRVLYDANKNGVWDAGNFKLKKQPEVVKPISKKLAIRSNWENVIEINSP